MGQIYCDTLEFVTHNLDVNNDFMNLDGLDDAKISETFRNNVRQTVRSMKNTIDSSADCNNVNTIVKNTDTGESYLVRLRK